jgi:hypothetical protein
MMLSLTSAMELGDSDVSEACVKCRRQKWFFFLQSKLAAYWLQCLAPAALEDKSSVSYRNLVEGSVE